MSLSRPLICSVVATLICLSFVTNAEATNLTKEEKARQLAQRELAYAQAIEAKKNPITKTELFGPKLNVIAVELSRTCWTLLKERMSSACPSYADLVPYDTTNQRYLGKFVEKDGLLQRAKGLIKNPSITLYHVNNTVVCVNCPFDVFKYSKQIIVDLPFHYKDNKDRKIVNNTRYEYHNRYVDNCAFARIAWLPGLLNDTINYLKSGCIETNFKEKVAVQMPSVEHDIKTSVAYKYQKWLEESKKLKTENCLKSDKC